jgi:hypothetical protein
LERGGAAARACIIATSGTSQSANVPLQAGERRMAFPFATSRYGVSRIACQAPRGALGGWPAEEPSRFPLLRGRDMKRTLAGIALRPPAGVVCFRRTDWSVLPPRTGRVATNLLPHFRLRKTKLGQLAWRELETSWSWSIPAMICEHPPNSSSSLGHFVRGAEPEQYRQALACQSKSRREPQQWAIRQLPPDSWSDVL